MSADVCGRNENIVRAAARLSGMDQLSRMFVFKPRSWASFAKYSATTATHQITKVLSQKSRGGTGDEDVGSTAPGKKNGSSLPMATASASAIASLGKKKNCCSLRRPAAAAPAVAAAAPLPVPIKWISSYAQPREVHNHDTSRIPMHRLGESLPRE